MMNRLLLSQIAEAKIPYVFKITEIEVYSIEELLYYCYHYYETIVDEFPMGDMITWISEELGITNITKFVEQMKKNKLSREDMLLSFLQIIDYFDEEEIKIIKFGLQKQKELSNEERLQRRGKLLVKYKHYKEALIFYRKLVAINPSAEAFHNLGVIYIYLMQPQLAIQCFVESLKLDNNTETIKSYLNALLLIKDYNTFNKAIKTYMEKYDSADLWFVHGLYFERMGNMEKASLSYIKVVELDNQYVDVYECIIKLFYKMSKINKAYKYLEYIKETYPFEYILNLSLYYELNSEEDKAAECLLELKEQYPRNDKVYLRLFELYKNAKKEDEAIKVMNEALELDTTNYFLKHKYLQAYKKNDNKYNQNIEELIQKLKDDYRSIRLVQKNN